MKFFLKFILITTISFLYSLSLLSQTTLDGMSIQAKTGERDLKNRTMTLTGEVQILFKGQLLKTDHAIIYQDTKKFVAEGNVLFMTPKATLAGRKIEMNYETNVGTIYSGFIQSGQMVLEGEVIEKTGEDQYLAYKSQFTSCTTCPPAWNFKGQTVEAEIGGYAYIKNTFFYVGTIPILWLPYLIIPLKSERQTGLLTPTIEFNGPKFEKTSFSIPYFWAISKNQDATFTLKNNSSRGLKGLSNYRYVLDKNSYGELDANFITDQNFGHSDRYTQFFDEKSEINRWLLNYNHFWVLPNDWIQRAQINVTSDLNYFHDFPEETPIPQNEPAAETRISLTKNTPEYHFSIDNSYYTNLLRGNPKSGSQDSVHRLPEITFSSTKKPIGQSGFFYNYDLKYTYFARDDFAYDDLTLTTIEGKQVRQVSHDCAGTDTDWDKDPQCKPVRDGKFDIGSDLIRSGQRFIAEPSITRPIQLGTYYNLIPKISYRETHYNFGIENVSNLNRRFLRTELKLQTTFSRIFGDLSNPTSERIKHEIEPEIISTSVPWLQQPSNHPFLGFNKSTEIPFFSREALSDDDLNGENGVQFDYDDRLYDRNLITYRITNKLTRKTWSQNTPNYSRFLTWRVSQTYDAHEAQRPGNRQPWSDIESILNIRLPHLNTYTKINFYPYQKLSNTFSYVSINDDAGDYIKLGLTRKYTISSTNVDVSTRTEDYTLQVGTSMRYVNFAGRIIYNGNDTLAAKDGGRIKDITFAVIMRPPGNCWGINFVHHQQIDKPLEEQIFRFTFDFLFDGNQQLQSPSKLLSSFNF